MILFIFLKYHSDFDNTQYGSQEKKRASGRLLRLEGHFENFEKREWEEEWTWEIIRRRTMVQKKRRGKGRFWKGALKGILLSEV